MTERTSRALAWTLGGVAWLFGIGFVLALPSAPAFRLSDGLFQAGTALTGVAFASVGVVIATRQRANRIGWLFLAIGCWMALTALIQTYIGLVPASRPGFAYANWASNWVWIPAYFLAFPMLLLLFPDGRPPTPRWRWLEGAIWICIAVAVLTTMLHPDPGGEQSGFNPFVDLSAIKPLLDVLLALSSVIGLFGGLIAAAVALVRRYRRAATVEREQLKWFVYATVATIVLLPTRSIYAADHPFLAVIGLVTAVLLPAASLVAILKYRLFDIDVVIRKTVIYVVTAALLLGTFAVVTWVVTSWVSSATEDRYRLIAGIVVGVLVWPMRSVAIRISNRLVFGRRATPYQVLSEFTERVGATYSDEDVTSRMAQLLRDATGATTARIWLAVGDSQTNIASAPADVPSAEWPDDGLDVTYRGERLGGLSVEMPANDPLDPTRERLIHDLAGQVGPVLANVRLLEELRASRRRIVAAQDERAKKLERDIHDGAQQQLVALTIQLKLAASLVGKDPEKERELLEQLGGQANDALEDLRNLARGIYPPLLADKGLGAALEAQARKAIVPTTVQADEVGRFAQDVESAVYFSCLEALQNIAKYANATSARIALMDGSGELRFSVTDDGDGFDASATSYGSGLQGIADRLAAIGGDLTVVSAPGQGTSITGSVPVVEGGRLA